MPPRPTIYKQKVNKEDTSLDASIHAKNSWADEMDTIHPYPQGYAKPQDDINENKESHRLDLLMSKLDVVAGQLFRLHDDLKFTNERVSTIESLLNVHSTSAKQAAFLNAAPTGETMEEDDYVVSAGIDTSESIVIANKLDIDYLKEENHFLKRNLQTNIDKLNEALKAVDLIQNMIV